MLNNFNDTTAKSFRTIADGCPGLIFQHSSKGVFYQNKKQLPAGFLYGQATKHNTLELSGQFSTVGIFFYPNALKTIFGLDASELTDSCIDLDFLSSSPGFQLSESLLNCSSTDEQIEIVSSFLFSQMQKNKQQVNVKMEYALSNMLLSKGNIFLKELTKSLNLSERSFERKFKEYIGLSPKLFSRICRFQASLKQLKHNNYNKLSDIAFENDYADQSHFIRTFKEFSGFSPNQYQQQSYEVVENLSEVMN
jgi:AraC-like DNA-binding protein